jgi:glutaredoxin 3
MFSASRFSKLLARGSWSTISNTGDVLRKKPTAASHNVIGRDIRLVLSTLLPASLGTTLHISSLEQAGNSVDNHLTQSSHNAITTTSTTKSSGWGQSIFSRLMSSSSSASEPESTTPTLVDEITKLVGTNKVVIFSKSYCPYCSATKDLFERMDVEGVVVIELDQDPRGQEMQQELQRRTGQRTVPNVFVNGKHLGGNSDAQSAARNGKLQEMLH